MNKVELGTDKIPSIAIGTWSWGTGKNGGDQVFGNSYDYNDLFPVYECGIKNGLTLWDTAAVYGMGASEEILGKCMKSYPDITISTKYSPRKTHSEQAMEESFENSIKRLHHSPIDIYWIHNSSDVKKWTNQIVHLYKAGKIKHIGVSNHSLDQIKEASSILEENGIHLDAVQNHYSLLYRKSEEDGILEWCEKNNTRFFAYMVLEQGALSDKYNAAHPFPEKTRRADAFPPEILGKIEPLIRCLKTIGEKHLADVSQIAIAWAMKKGTIPLIGATKVSQIESIRKVDDIQLSLEEITQLEQCAIDTGVSIKGRWEP